MTDIQPKNLVHAFLCFLALSGFVPTAHADTTIMVQDSWVREAPPGAPMAGYMVLHNSGTGEKTLVGASSEAFEKVMVHRSFVENGVAKMSAVDSVPIGPGDKVKFESGGLHLMLMQARQTFKAEDTIRISLEFDDGSVFDARFTVRSPDMDHGDSQGHAEH